MSPAAGSGLMRILAKEALMHPLRLMPVVVFAVSAALVIGPRYVHARDISRPLTPDWIERVAQKEQARRADPLAIGTSAQQAPNPAGPGTQRRIDTRAVRISKADALARFEESRVQAARYIDALLAEGAAAAAARVRADLDAQERRIRALPEGESTVDVPALESGSHSITMSTLAYDMSFNPKDPNSFVFYNVGSSWDANWDLQNWTTPKWSAETVCVSDLQIYTWDAQHGGTDGWERQDYHLKYNASWCAGARYHLRLFDRGFTDTHGQYGRWSVSEPHHDRAGDHCVDDWDGAQEVLHQSFIDDATGLPHPFVGAMYTVNWGNGGTYGCATADSYGWYVEFKY